MANAVAKQTLTDSVPISEVDDDCEGCTDLVYHAVMLWTLDALAQEFHVTPRCVRNWVKEHGCPAERRSGGRSPLFYFPAVELWLQTMRRRSPDFGRHGGFR